MTGHMYVERQHLFPAPIAQSRGVTTVISDASPLELKGELIIPLTRQNNEIVQNMEFAASIPCTVQEEELELAARGEVDIWHRRLGHFNNQSVNMNILKRQDATTFRRVTSSTPVMPSLLARAHRRNIPRPPRATPPWR